jgi:hypothetical protein
MNSHKFKIGQAVNYAPAFSGAGGADLVFKVTYLLPPERRRISVSDQRKANSIALGDAGALVSE